MCPPPAHSLCLPRVEKKDVSHSTVPLNHYPPVYPSVRLIFQSAQSVHPAAGITLCSPFILAENISMWSWIHLSEPDGCLSNCHSPLPHLLHSRLNTKKGQRALAWFKTQGIHTWLHIHFRHPNTFHFPVIAPCIFTLALTHSPCISTFTISWLLTYVHSLARGKKKS